MRMQDIAMGILPGSSGDLRRANLFTDGNMELVNVSAWPTANATATKQTASPYQGVRWLRLVNTSAVSSGYAIQSSILVNGQTYRITGVGKGDAASGYPRIWCGSMIWTGTTSSSWQTLDETFVAGSTDIRLYSLAGMGNTVGWDDLYISLEA